MPLPEQSSGRRSKPTPYLSLILCRDPNEKLTKEWLHGKEKNNEAALAKELTTKMTSILSPLVKVGHEESMININSGDRLYATLRTPPLHDPTTHVLVQSLPLFVTLLLSLQIILQWILSVQQPLAQILLLLLSYPDR
jgi:hypothetical protein